VFVAAGVEVEQFLRSPGCRWRIRMGLVNALDSRASMVVD